ncbi:MAG: putative hydroxymethylpyrimidine transport system substrate-binding protein [Clostridia bacterium]|jgi:putative hydroxymethylpyrimidine transport system substrate-binding protein|nr:putative hydroxymethylpyrimidine transport system substrate-binding protein [Clostridia bacterium]MDN5321608.1 putative hydroxymethylpyrimidine transport system substrate-binding protein [Clostridia bacterium]
MKKVFTYFLIVIVLLGAVGCNNQKTEGLKEVTVMLDWYPNAVHSFLYAALDKGYFQKEGLKVKILMPAETSDPLKLVAAGKTTFAISYQPQLVMARANDIPVVSIASIVGHPLNTLMVLEEKEIQNPKDLEGKTVGYSLPVYEAIVKTAVKKAGGDISKLNLIDIGWDLIPALVTKKVDAISGGFINHEKILIEKEGYKVREIDPVQYGVPDYYELIMITSEELVTKDRELIKRFWQAVNKGQDYVKNHPEEALKLLFANQSEQFPLDKDVEKESLNILLPLMEPFGKQELERWQEVINWMHEMKLIEKKPEADKAFVSL